MKIKVSNILLSLIMTLTIISLAVVLTLACKPLYYLEHPCAPYSGNYRLHDFGD